MNSGSPSSSSVTISWETGNATVPAQKQVNNTQLNPAPNHFRRLSFKQNGTSSSAIETVVNLSEPGSFIEPPLHNPPPRGHNHNQRNEFASQSQGGNDNPLHRSSYRNQSANHNQNHGGMCNQEHGNYNCNIPWGASWFGEHAPTPVQPFSAPFMAAQPIHFW